MGSSRCSIEKTDLNVNLIDLKQYGTGMFLSGTPSSSDLRFAQNGTELVITGRYAHPKIIAAADLVTEMKEVKHYYHKGVKARIGIEK